MRVGQFLAALLCSLVCMAAAAAVSDSEWTHLGGTAQRINRKSSRR